jgi:hypothetical protein
MMSANNAFALAAGDRHRPRGFKTTFATGAHQPRPSQRHVQNWDFYTNDNHISISGGAALLASGPTRSPPAPSHPHRQRPQPAQHLAVTVTLVGTPAFSTPSPKHRTAIAPARPSRALPPSATTWSPAAASMSAAAAPPRRATRRFTATNGWYN